MTLRIAGMTPVAFGKRIFKEFGDDDLSGLAAELSYRFFLIFPFVIFLAALGGLVASQVDVENPAQKFVDMFGDRLPDDASSVLQGQVEGVVDGPSAGLLTLGLLGTFYAAAGGVGSLVKAMNRAYDVPETRPFWKKIGLALGLTGLAGVAIIASLVLMVGGQIAAGDLADKAGLGDPFAYFIGVARFVVVAVFIAVAAAFLYWASPNIPLPFKWITPGAVLFTVGWLVLTVGFAFYVSNFVPITRPTARSAAWWSCSSGST